MTSPSTADSTSTHFPAMRDESPRDPLGLASTSLPPWDKGAKLPGLSPSLPPPHAAAAAAASDSIQSVRQMIAPLSKEQLIELIANAAIKFPEVLAEAKEMVDSSPASRRLMIRNIAFSTKDSAFRSLFEQYGLIDDAAIVRGKDGSSRGYGFVTCRSTESVRAILEASLVLDGRNLLAKLAGDPFADFSAGGCRGAKGSRRKLFVRNLCQKTTSDTLRSIFEKYGELEECVVVMDAEGKSRGYGFVTFVSAEAAIRAVQEPQRIIDERIVFVAFATPTRVRQAGGRDEQSGEGRSRRGSSDLTSSGSRYAGAHAIASVAAAYPYGASYPIVSPYFRNDTYGVQQLRLPMNGYTDYLTSMQALQAAQRHYSSAAGDYGY